METCPNCTGVGWLPSHVARGYHPTCPSCGGQGKVPISLSLWDRCAECEGYGSVGMEAAPEGCAECKGRGIIEPY